LVARGQLVSQITTLKNCVRGILKTFGLVMRKGLRSQFPKHVREAVADNPMLAAMYVKCTAVRFALHVPGGDRRQVSPYHRTGLLMIGIIS
jgi:hypothetical protein